MKISRSSRRQPCWRSALERNLNASASSTNPKVTFTALSQPPDLPSSLSSDGNTAKRVKGSARPKPKPKNPSRGPILPPLWIDTTRLPINGTVQENDNVTEVNAIKNNPKKFWVFALLYRLVAQDEGRLISNAPRKEIPKIRNTRKNAILTIQLVENACSASGPKN